ncbi:hypothetical protein SLE2022_015050 [Rubroshorea leprosula]
MLRYSDKSILGIWDSANGFFRLGEGGLAKNVKAVSDAQTILLESLRSKAEKGVLLGSLQWGREWLLYQTPFMHLYSALLICPSFSAVLACLRLLKEFRVVVRAGEAVKYLGLLLLFGSMTLCSTMLLPMYRLRPHPTPHSPRPNRPLLHPQIQLIAQLSRLILSLI